MKKAGKVVIGFLLLFWELPQNLLGFVIFAFLRIKKSVLHIQLGKGRFFIETLRTGVSLGCLVFWTRSGNRFPYLENDCRMHEYGHARQSVMLGPFYLFVIGIPSVSRVLFRKWYSWKFGQNWKNYYNGFPENWADQLGGVIKKA